MTVFTVNAINNNYFINGEPSREIEKICFRSWKRYYPNLIVYDYNSDEVKYCIKKYNRLYNLVLQDQHYVNVFADIIRLYILSKYNDMLYFDCDMYLLNNEFYFNSNKLCLNCDSFCIMANKTDTDTPKKMLEHYDKELPSITDYRDNFVLTNSNIQYGKIYSKTNGSFMHLPGFDDYETSAFKTIIKSKEDFDTAYNKYTNLLSPGSTKKLIVFYDDVFDNYKELWQKYKPLNVRFKPLFKITNIEDKNKIIDIIKNSYRYIEV